MRFIKDSICGLTSTTFLLLAFLFANHAFAEFNPTYPALQQSPSASYHLDGNAEDTSGHGHHGNLVGGAAVPGFDGSPNSALLFDGLDDAITLPEAESILGANPDGWSGAFWMNAGNTAEAEVVMLTDYNGNGWDDRFGVFVCRRGDGRVHAVVRKGHLEEWDCVSIAPVPAGEWHFVTFTASKSSGTLRLYIDGVLNDQKTIDSTADYIENVPLYIGKTYWLGSFTHFFPGVLDEMHLYNRALGAQEVEDLYLATDATAYYPLDGDAHDISGNGYDGVLAGGTVAPDHNGIPTSALSFDGLDDGITLPAAETVLGANPEGWSGVFWMNPVDTEESEVVMLTDYNSTGWDTRFGIFVCRRADGYVHAVIRKDHLEEWDCVSDLPLPAGEWHLVAFTASKTTGIMRLYIDGMLHDEKTFDTTVDYIEDVPLYIGKTYWLGGYTHFYPGALDDVRLYNRTLAADEVADLFLRTDTVAYYPLDGDAQDLGANGYHGILAGGEAVPNYNGSANSALRFDGIDDAITLPTAETILGPDPDGWSYAFWMNADNTTEPEVVLLSDYNSSGWDTRFGVFVVRRADGYIHAVMRKAHLEEWDCVSASPVPAGEWHFVAFTASKTTGHMRLYLDGVLQSEMVFDTSVDYIEDVPLYIGKTYWLGGFTHFFPGAIDNVCFWNRELDPGEIVTGVEDPYIDPIVPDPAANVVLSQNHPNPFNPRTTIEFSLPRQEQVSLRIYDLRGSLVRTLVEGTFSTGTYQYVWDGNGASGFPAASGTYFYRLKTDRALMTKTMLLLK
jgi:hypothetical protein